MLFNIFAMSFTGFQVKVFTKVSRTGASEIILSPTPCQRFPKSRAWVRQGLFLSCWHKFVPERGIKIIVQMKSYLSVSFLSKVQHCWPYRYKTKSLGGRGLRLGAVDGSILNSISYALWPQLAINVLKWQIIFSRERSRPINEVLSSTYFVTNIRHQHRDEA